MNTTDYFIGDTHFSHKNILEYESEARPFYDIDQMNEAIIERWNSVVKPTDRVFHLGDFCFGEKNLVIAERLNGIKYLILGNHDTLETEKYLRYFKKVMGCMQYKGCLLSHYPVHESQFARFKANIHGHLHSQNIPDARYINVSCEQNNLTPISWNELILKTLLT